MSWWRKRHVSNVALGAAIPTLFLREGVATCSVCGSEEFRYEESYPTTRTMEANEEGLLVFDGSFEWTNGDCVPGVVCDRCDTALAVPEEVELGWG